MPSSSRFYHAGGLQTVSTSEYYWILTLGLVPLLSLALVLLVQKAITGRKRAERAWKGPDPEELNRLLLCLEQAVEAQSRRSIRLLNLSFGIGCAIAFVGFGPAALHLARWARCGATPPSLHPAAALGAGSACRWDKPEDVELHSVMELASSLCRVLCFIVPVCLMRPTDRIALRIGLFTLMLMTAGMLTEVRRVAPTAARGGSHRDAPLSHPCRHLRH
eukprot:scaffold11123_cov28-Tisochrysis_lutea.AAC.4